MSEREPMHAETAGTIEVGGDLTVNRLGFGAMRVTGEGIWGQPADPGEAKAVLRRAVELGVNFIDTADAYGPDVSEELIREALYPYPDDLVIATKGGLERTGPGKWLENGRPEHLMRGLRGKPAATATSNRSRSTSSTGPTPRCRWRTRSARSSPSRSRARSGTSGSRTSPRTSCGAPSVSPRSCRSRTATTSTTAGRSRSSTSASRSRSCSCRGRRSGS